MSCAPRARPRRVMRLWRGCCSSRRRCGSPTRPARPATGSRVPAGIACTVAAPSKIPRAAGDRVKTDRRDAERLARLLRLGELVAVRVPEPHEEAARDLVRAREDARGDLMRARHRLSKLLLRHGLVYDASAWTLAHDAWLRGQRFERRALATHSTGRSSSSPPSRRSSRSSVGSSVCAGSPP